MYIIASDKNTKQSFPIVKHNLFTVSYLGSNWVFPTLLKYLGSEFAKASGSINQGK
jgi:hypothetical protein